MQRHDLPEVLKRLAALAELYGAKPPTPAAAELWAHVLGECLIDDVRAALTDWPKARAKMPLPSEILALARERMSERVEAQAKREAAAARVDWTPDKLAPADGQRSASYLAAKHALAELKHQPKPHPKLWAEILRDRELAGEQLSAVQQQNWRAAIGARDAVPQETEAEREARIEREAIVAEG